MLTQLQTRRPTLSILLATLVWAALVFAAIMAPRPALAAPISVFGSGSQYGTIDSDTGVYTGIGRLTDSVTNASIALSGFAFGGDGNLYGVTGVDGPGANGEGNYLWRFEPKTGISTDRHDLPVSLVTIAARPSDSLLFGYANDAPDGTANLYSFAATSTTPKLVGAIGVTTFGAVTFDNTDRLYLADSVTGNIYRVSTATGNSALFSATNVPNITAMAMVGNTLFAYSTDNRARYAINIDTGTTTYLGTYDIGGGDLIYGAAIAPFTIPEMGAGGLVVLAGMVGVLFARRGRK